MNKQVFNPYLPSYEYIADGEPHIFNNRIYVYGSHDKFNGPSFCVLDYVCWSCPVDDLTSWRYEGVIFERKQDPNGKKGPLNAMYAPDVVQGNDGYYYLYYFIGYIGLISVARCKTPAGKYEFLGHVKYKDGTLLGKKKEPLQFDPGVFKDDDGKIYLYTGFSPLNYPSFLLKGHKSSDLGPMGFELEDDMLTIKKGPVYLGIPSKKTGKNTEYFGHEFFEASSMRKINNKYYFIYSSSVNHELCYAISDNPLSDFKYGGVLVSIGDVGINGIDKKNARNYLGNTHGSILDLNGKYYIFYHRQTNRNSFSRQACAEKLTLIDNKFLQSELTSNGLNAVPLLGKGKYPSHIACHLYSKNGSLFYGVIKKRKGKHPYFTQSGIDRENNEEQYIANFSNGSTAVFRYFDLKDTKSISLIIDGKLNGIIYVYSNNKLCGELLLKGKYNKQEVICPLHSLSNNSDITITFKGTGHFDFYEFILN